MNLETTKEKTIIFDSLATADGFQIGWLHFSDQLQIEEPDLTLYYCENDFFHACIHFLKQGYEFENYYDFESDDINYFFDDMQKLDVDKRIISIELGLENYDL
jgi:hypothetical protein